MQHLYTPKDIKEVRDRMVKEQGGIDPILKEEFSETVCLDHDHSTQQVRAALNRNVNAFEGKVVNAYTRCLSWLTDTPLPEILRNLADYLERDYSGNPIHSGWLKASQVQFNKLSEGSKKAVLASLGSEVGGNSTERKKLFQKALMTRKWTYEGVLQIINKAKE